VPLVEQELLTFPKQPSSPGFQLPVYSFVVWSRFFPHSWLITMFVSRLTWHVPLVEQELLTIQEHHISPSVFSGVRVSRSLAWCVCLVDLYVSYFLLVIVESLLQFMDSDYPFGIFKLFLHLSSWQKRRLQLCYYKLWTPRTHDLPHWVRAR
jgi:hypothetical protein